MGEAADALSTRAGTEAKLSAKYASTEFGLFLLVRIIKKYKSIMFLTYYLGDNLLNDYMLKPYYIGYIH